MRLHRKLNSRLTKNEYRKALMDEEAGWIVN